MGGSAGAVATIWAVLLLLLERHKCMQLAARSYARTNCDAFLKSFQKTNRYMVVLRMGGAYADIDAECLRPLDAVIAPSDTLVAGWDAEAPDDASAARRGLARRRQLLPWFFAAAPGHPALRELCDRVARGAHARFSNSSARDTLERTGAALFTDVVLRHATGGGAARASDPWRVRVLPRVAFGAHPSGDGGVAPDLREVVVVHHGLGTWQRPRAALWGLGWLLGAGAGAGGGAPISRRKAIEVAAPRARLGGGGGGDEWPAPGPMVAELLPVSAAFDPPFTVMTRLAGAGDAGGGGADVGAEVARFGGYQPGLPPGRRPSVVEALTGALGGGGGGGVGGGSSGSGSSGNSGAGGGSGSSSSSRPAAAAAAPASGASTSGDGGGVLVDVGAGEGFFSLAAAARGHRALAFEAAPRSAEALRASVAYNGFGGRVEVVSNVTLGAAPGVVCVPAAQQQQQIFEDEEEGEDAAGEQEQQQQTEQQARRAPPPRPLRVADRRLRERRLREAAARAQRGYMHAADPAAAASAPPCGPGTRALRRVTLSEALGARRDVGAVRIAAHGHEGLIVKGLLPYLERVHRPRVIYAEFSPPAMRAAGDADPAALIAALRARGYGAAAHAGRVCDLRWSNATGALRAGGAFSPAAQLAYHQPTWCKLRADGVGAVVARAGAGGAPPENLLFVLGPEPATRGDAAGAARPGAAPAAAAAAPAAPAANASAAAAAGARR